MSNPISKQISLVLITVIFTTGLCFGLKEDVLSKTLDNDTQTTLINYNNTITENTPNQVLNSSNSSFINDSSYNLTDKGISTSYIVKETTIKTEETSTVSDINGTGFFTTTTNWLWENTTHLNDTSFETTVMPTLTNDLNIDETQARLPEKKLNDKSLSNSTSEEISESNSTAHSLVGKANITGVGIKTTVSVSFHLMDRENETLDSLGITNITSNLVIPEYNETAVNETGDQKILTNTSNISENITESAVETKGELITESVLYNISTTIIEDIKTSVLPNVSDDYLSIISTGENPENVTSPFNESITNSSPKPTNITELSETSPGKMTPISNVTLPTISNVTIEASNYSLFSTTPEPVLTKMAAVVKIIRGLQWMPRLGDRRSPEYRNVSRIITNTLEDFYRSTPLRSEVKKIEIDGFSEDGVLVDYFLMLSKPKTPNALVHLFNSYTKMRNDSLGEFTIDPKATEFHEVRKVLVKPTVRANLEPLVPQWIIAVIVIASASLIFVLLFSAVTIYGRHYGRRKYSHKFQDEDPVFDTTDIMSAGKLSHSAYENLAADIVYDSDKINRDWTTGFS